MWYYGSFFNDSSQKRRKADEAGHWSHIQASAASCNMEFDRKRGMGEKCHVILKPYVALKPYSILQGYTTRKEFHITPFAKKYSCGYTCSARSSSKWKVIVGNPSSTLQKMNKTVKIKIIARETYLRAGDSYLCQFKWNRASMTSKKGDCPFMKYGRALSVSEFQYHDYFSI